MTLTWYSIVGILLPPQTDSVFEIYINLYTYMTNGIKELLKAL